MLEKVAANCVGGHSHSGSVACLDLNLLHKLARQAGFGTSPLLILISSGTQSTHTTLYLFNKAVICFFAVPNKRFQKEMCMRNI